MKSRLSSCPPARECRWVRRIGEGSGKIKRFGLALWTLLVLAGLSPAAEIASNGLGGGPWTDPATWRGQTVPTAGDDVVILKNDVVVFDKADDDKVACRKLQIDPKGGLTFKKGGGKLTLKISDGVQCHGVIRLDGTRSATDSFTIHMTGSAPDQRKIKLGKYGALLLFGKADLPEGKKNVALIAAEETDGKWELPVAVEADGGAMIDWQRIAGHHVKLDARNLDNTGAKAHERLKIFGCGFTGPSRLRCESCDTPEFTRNTFEYTGAKTFEDAVINAHTSPLVEIKGNVIKAPHFAIGITVNAATDAILINNTVEQCRTGIRGGYGLPNLMIKDATLRGCTEGLYLESATGVVEGVVVDGATSAYFQTNGAVQYNHCLVKGLAKKGQAFQLDQGSASLLNCNLGPTDCKVIPQKLPEKPGPAPLTCNHYLIIVAKKSPPGSLIEVRTLAPAIPPGAADPNVRNASAPLVQGITPLPKSLAPVVAKAWSFDYRGKLQPAPEYGVKLFGPAPKEGAERPLLKALVFRPREDGFRADPNDPAPTLEVPYP